MYREVRNRLPQVVGYIRCVSRYSRFGSRVVTSDERTRDRWGPRETSGPTRQDEVHSSDRFKDGPSVGPVNPPLHLEGRGEWGPPR